VAPERIAQRLRIPVEQVQQAVDDMEAARLQISSDIIDMAVNAEVLTAMYGAGRRIQTAMQAMRWTGDLDSEGRRIMEPDHAVALDAITVAGDLVEKVRPKSGGGVAVNVGINNNGNNGNGVGTVKTFEQRVREKRGVLPEGDVKFLSDGKGEEIVDGDLIDDEDDELEDDELGDGTSDAEIEEADNQ